MRDIFEIIETVASSSATVLIEGDTGTGKELIAKAIHFNSNRKNKSFIKVNCAALPNELLESEMFGHEKGSFTGADRRMIGKFEMAHGGTILLDEIGEIPRNLQAKLLRVLQEKEFYRVGGSQIVRTDARVIATTNKNLREAVEKGEFREDLFYRLNVVPIYIPPLRERASDIPLLVDSFLEKFNRQTPKNVTIEPSVIQYFMKLRWAGNVRELENCIERAVVMARTSVLSLDNFLIQEEEVQSEQKVSQNNMPPVGTTLREMEKNLILETLSAYKGNKTKASQTLGMSIRTIRNKLKEYGLSTGLSRN
jgi:transcriptional regulator with PAS, ATPase and Fis domain